MRKNFLFIFGVLSLATLVLGCNAMRGFGKDVESSGKNIQETVGHND
ncbi:MAG: ECN family pore-forming entericidin [Candidatus Omnitrophota bacterium]